MGIVQEYFRHKAEPATKKLCKEIVGSTKVGIEIELENAHHYPKVSGWATKQDGSLRNNGIEFVFKTPAGGHLIKRRLETIRNYIQSSANFETNQRCSVHVHVDVRDLEWEELCNFILAYIVAEPFLFQVCGKERAENIYSLALYKGTHQIDRIAMFLNRGIESTQYLFRTKYTAFNLKAMISFGSIEFRGHRGTTDMSEIQYWTNLLLQLKEFSKETCVKSHVERYKNSPIEMLQGIFGDLLPEVSNETLKETKDNLLNFYKVIHYQDYQETEIEIKHNHPGQEQTFKVRANICAV
jgi:hypothetical protein